MLGIDGMHDLPNAPRPRHVAADTPHMPSMQARKVSPPTLAAEEAAAKEAMEAEVVVECEMEAVGVRRTAVDVLSSAGLAIIVSKAAAPAAHAALVGLSWVDPHRRPLPPKQTKDIVLVDAGLVHFVYCEKMPWYSLQAFHTTLSGGGAAGHRQGTKHHEPRFVDAGEPVVEGWQAAAGLPVCGA